jgi:hypothetical protein
VAKPKKKRDWNLTVYVPGAEPVASDHILSKTSALHAINIIQNQAGGVKSIASKDFEDQWSQTVEGLISSVNDWTENAVGAWQIEEITVGLTVSGEGQLAFIAKAGAKGSIELKLTRKDAQKTV